MSKKCMVNRNNKRKKLAKLSEAKRKELKEIIKNNKGNVEEVFSAYQKLASMSRNSNKTRVRNICFVTGRSRGNYRRFGLSRIQLRKMASFADIPGVKKSSW